MIRSILQESLSGVLLGCVRKNTELIIFTESGAAASQLRFYGLKIRETLNAESGEKFESIRIRLIQPTKTRSPRVAVKNYPSPQTIGNLRECTRFISENDLRNSLERLADTLENQSPRTGFTRRVPGNGGPDR